MNKPKTKIRVTEPSITKKEIALVTKAVTDGWGANAFAYIKQFEASFAKYIGVKYAIATSSCTGSLHIALAALGIGKGDEVILPDITWASTAFAILYVGAKPVFVDMDSSTWCISPDSIKKNLTKRTKAIIPVHLYGHPADMDPIRSIANKHGLFVIEDAAESIGAKYKSKQTGSMGDFASFSFHGTKTLTTGEGGILLTNNERLYKKAQFIANMGKSSTRLFWNDGIGLKYKMSDIQAALGLAQLSRISELLKKKKTIYAWYQEELNDYEDIQLNVSTKATQNSYWMPTIIWGKQYKKEKEWVMDQLATCNIDPRPFFYPLSQMPPFKTKVHNPVSYDISTRGINLPCGYSLTRTQARYVAHTLATILQLKTKTRKPIALRK